MNSAPSRLGQLNSPLPSPQLLDAVVIQPDLQLQGLDAEIITEQEIANMVLTFR